MGALGAASEGQYRRCTDTHDNLHQPGAQVPTVMLHSKKFHKTIVVHCQKQGMMSKDHIKEF